MKKTNADHMMATPRTMPIRTSGCMGPLAPDCADYQVCACGQVTADVPGIQDADLFRARSSG